MPGGKESENRLLAKISGDNVDGSTNIIPMMGMEPLREGYRKILGRIYAPKYYYERVLTFLREYQPPVMRIHLEPQYILALWRSIYQLGIRGAERVHYWRLFFWSLFRHPSKFPLAVAAIRSAFPDVTILEQTANTRFAGGNNIALRHAIRSGGELFCLLNNDTIVDPEMVTWLVRAWQSIPEAGMVSPRILYHSAPDRLWYAGGSISMWTGTLRHLGIREADGWGPGQITETGFATGCCLLTGREVVETTGFLDESFFIYTEDVDWCLRARRRQPPRLPAAA